MDISPEPGSPGKPLVLVTGAAGNIGRSLGEALGDRFRVVGLDLVDADEGFPILEVDLTDDASVSKAMARLRRDHGSRIASVIHLAAYFDFSGEDKPAYRTVNVEGTRRLLKALQDFEVGQFVYSGTMLVHAPGQPGETIDEHQPIEPGWAYPRSKAEAEAVIRAGHGRIPYVLLHLAGLYDEVTSVPTLANQIARIYQRDFQSHFYSGSTTAGQAVVHRDDMIDAIVRTVERRQQLPEGATILVGEPETLSYAELQDRLGALIHGEEQWATMRIPAPIAAVGAWAQDVAEPVVPDALDQGERPFIRPFMTRMASDHYALDIARARELLGWEPRHRLSRELPAMVATLKRDPAGWYRANHIPVPPFVTEASDEGYQPEQLRVRHENHLRAEHGKSRWAHFVNMALGTWIAVQPPLVGGSGAPLAVAECLLGVALVVFAAVALSWQAVWARWACAAIGALIAAAPFVLWTDNAAAYLSDTLVGGLVMGLAVATRPEPGPSAVAVHSGPVIPPGWDYNPSGWGQRIPIIALALLGLYVSRYLAGYQLELVDGVWEPFFAGSATDPRNGTEEIITSSVSRAWPVPDAALGGYTYLLEIVTGVIGSQRRWRTMPWLVLLFGLMVAPLGIVSIAFIVIQPIVIGTWSTLALIAAAAMLVQIPYSVDELLATCQFLRRRSKAGRNWLRVFLFGDTDEAKAPEKQTDLFERPPGVIVREMISGGVSLPWNLAVAGLVGLWLMFTRLTLGAQGTMADVDHLMGSLVLTVVSIAAAEVARPVRFLLVPLGVAVAASPFMLDGTAAQHWAGVAAGLGLALLALRRGVIRSRYGEWSRLLV